VPDDPESTVELRHKARGDRLTKAEPAQHPLRWNDNNRDLTVGVTAPLTTMIEQRGAVAVSIRSGAPLAVSPNSWTEGCPRIHKFLPSSDSVDVVAYLDPENGELLCVDVVPIGDPCSFAIVPKRWTEARSALAGKCSGPTMIEA
jgi:hypothetical protein